MLDLELRSRPLHDPGDRWLGCPRGAPLQPRYAESSRPGHGTPPGDRIHEREHPTLGVLLRLLQEQRQLLENLDRLTIGGKRELHGQEEA